MIKLEFILKPLYSIFIWIITLLIISIVISTIISCSFKNTLFLSGLIFLCISVMFYIGKHPKDVTTKELYFSLDSLILVISAITSMLISHFVL